MNRVSDFLSTFGGKPPVCSCRAGAWQGFPSQSFEDDEWTFWIFGETFPRCQTAADARAFRNGHFLIWGWNKKHREYHAWTDRFGTLHGYYADDGQRRALGTHFQSVAKAASRGELDWEALAGFFSFGFFPGDRTYYKDLKILRPASHYVFDFEGRLKSRERYWKWHYEPNLKRSYEETVLEFGRLFNRVVEDQTRDEKIAIPVSGGLDSRSTVAGLQGKFWAYSYGYHKNSEETKIAQKVAHARGLDFQAFTIEPYLFEKLDGILSCTEGFQDVTQCRQAFVTEELEKHGNYVLAAHWGDVWMDGMLDHRPPTLDHRQILNDVVKKIQKKGGDWLVENLCQSRLGNQNPKEFLRGMISDELKEFDAIEDPDFKMKAFKTDHWSFRWTCASLRMFQAAAFPRLPFYDNRLTDFFCTVPADFVRGRRLQIDYLKRFAPDLAHIEWQPYGANLYQYQRSNSLSLPERIFKKLARMISGKKIIQRNWERQFLNDKGKKGLETHLLREGLKIHEFVALSKMKALVSDLYQNPNAENGYRVSMLLTFSSWLEKYHV